MKNFLSLHQLDKTQLRQVLSAAVEMKRIIANKHKKGPQFAGRTLVALNKSTMEANTALSLAYSYLGGTVFSVTAGTDFYEKAMTLDAYGVNTICLQHDNFDVVDKIAQNVQCEVINGGTRFVNPLLALSVLATVQHTCDRLSNLNVLLIGNKEQSIVAELAYAFTMYESNLFAYIPTEDTEFLQRSHVNAVSEINAAFGGMDVVIDLGVQQYSPLERYYGSKYGLPKSVMGKARVDAPLLFTRKVVDANQIPVDYPFNTVDRQYKDYISVIMAVLYAFYRN